MILRFTPEDPEFTQLASKIMSMSADLLELLLPAMPEASRHTIGRLMDGGFSVAVEAAQNSAGEVSLMVVAMTYTEPDAPSQRCELLEILPRRTLTPPPPMQ